MENGTYQEAAGQAATPDIFEKVIDGVVGKILSNTGSNTVFGEPVREENRTVVPVARLRYGFGFGAGVGPSQVPEDDAPSGGGGGGGNLSVRPVGYIETTAEGSHFVPIIDWSRLLTIAAVCTGLSALMVTLGAVLNSREDQAGMKL